MLRRLRAVRGSNEVHFSLRPRWEFKEAPKIESDERRIHFEFPTQKIVLWTSFEVETNESGAWANFTLHEGDETWVMFGIDNDPSPWSESRCRAAHAENMEYWHRWAGSIQDFVRRDPKLLRCAIAVHLLAYAPHDSVVAAVTTSLPERIGGDRNYDYRYTWVRDASISAAFLAIMNDSKEVARYFDWLCRLDSKVASPLQVCYRPNGGTEIETRKLEGVAGYRNSQPVRVGNRAYKQRQVGSLGWFADSALIFVEAGGQWIPEYDKMLRRAADHICEAWREKDSGVWELAVEAHYVASKLMAWVTLDRALRIGRKTGEPTPDKWQETLDLIRREILEKGWSDNRGSFLQRYGSDALDAAALLVPLMGFLPPEDPRVLGTLDAIERELVIDGLVHRFDPSATLGGEQLPIGQFEGAFLPATFWYAHALAGAGRIRQAEQILAHCEEVAGELGLFAEEVDAHQNCFLGNTPLLFSQVEYGRALLALREQRSRNNSKGNS